MNAIAFQQWAEQQATSKGRPQLALWVGGSILFHAVLFALLLLGPDWKPMRPAEHAQQARDPIEMVMTQLVRASTPTPADEDVATDRPDNALPPPVRKIDAQSELQARPDSPLAAGLEPIDPKAIREFVRRNAEKDREDRDPFGHTWATCSMMSPERRVLEPGCDGLLLRPPPGNETGLAILQAPDAATLAAIQKYNPARTAQDEANARGTRDSNTDRAFRNEGDDYYGPRPWE